MFFCEKQLTDELIEDADIVVILTAHTNVDYGKVLDKAKFVFDVKNVYKNNDRLNIEVL